MLPFLSFLHPFASQVTSLALRRFATRDFQSKTFTNCRYLSISHSFIPPRDLKTTLFGLPTVDPVTKSSLCGSFPSPFWPQLPAAFPLCCLTVAASPWMPSTTPITLLMALPQKPRPWPNMPTLLSLQPESLTVLVSPHSSPRPFLLVPLAHADKPPKSWCHQRLR